MAGRDQKLFPRLVCAAGGPAAPLLAAVPALGRAYTPTFWARGPHAQTIIGRELWRDTMARQTRRRRKDGARACFSKWARVLPSLSFNLSPPLLRVAARSPIFIIKPIPRSLQSPATSPSRLPHMTASSYPALTVARSPWTGGAGPRGGPAKPATAHGRRPTLSRWTRQSSSCCTG
jgi:hypothetical protein